MRHIPVKNLIKCKVQQNEEGLNDLLADAFFLFIFFTVSFSLSEVCFGLTAGNYGTVTWKGEPGMCSSPHFTARM